MDEIIQTNRELRKQLAEDDIIIAEYKSKIRSLERELEYCNSVINHLSNTLIHSEEEIECLKKENSTLSKELRKALKDVGIKEECLMIRDSQIQEYENKILTLKNRIKIISSRKMSQTGNIEPTIGELDSAFNVIQNNVNIIRNHFYPRGGSSPSRFTKSDIIEKIKEIRDNVQRLNEVAKWYISAQSQLDMEKVRVDQANHDLNIVNRKYDKWKNRTKTERGKHDKWKQRFRLLQQNVNINMASTADALQVVGPELAKIPSYVGQETPDEYITKIDQILSSIQNLTTDGAVMANDRANASITPVDILNVYKSKMGGKFAPVPDEYPAGTNIDRKARFMNWLNYKFTLETIGTQQSALIGLMQEQFTSFDNPDTFERKIRPYLIGLDNQTVIPILLSKLPENLEMRIRHIFERRANNAQTVDNLFIDLKNAWMQRRPGRDVSYQIPPQQAVVQQAIPPQQPVVQQVIPPQQPVVQQPIYHKVDPKSFVEEKYGQGTWNLDSRATDTYNTTLDIIKRGNDIIAFNNQGNNRDIESIIDRKIQQRYERETNPRFEKINKYRNIIDIAHKGIETEENRPDDPMDVDYLIANLLKSNQPKRTVNRTKTKAKKKTNKKTNKKTKKKVRHIILNEQEEGSSSSEEEDSSSSEEESSDEEEQQYVVNSSKKKQM